MRYLYIDTSSSYLYTAIVEDNKVLSEIKVEHDEDFFWIPLSSPFKLYAFGLTQRVITSLILVYRFLLLLYFTYTNHL